MSYKKIKRIFIFILLFLVTAELGVVLSNNLFFNKVSAQEVAKRSMPKEAANAVKHAYAASLVYSTFRMFFFSENTSENITIFLGKTNEVAEIVFKSRKDSTLEIMKDLGNNLLGICAAKLIEENRNNPAMEDRISLIGNLAEREKLLLTQDDVLISSSQKEEARKARSYRLAAKWFEENRQNIPCDF